MDCSPPGSSVHGIFQARILEWVTISFSRGYSRQRDRTCISCVSYVWIGMWILYCWATWEAIFTPFISVQLLSRVQLFAIPWTTAHQASLSITNSWSLLKLMAIEWVMPSNHLTLWHPLLLLPSILPSIRVFSNESVLRIRWPKCWNFTFRISPSNEYSGLISSRIDWFDSLLPKRLSRVFSNTTVQKHQFFSVQLSLWSNSHIHMWLMEKP